MKNIVELDDAIKSEINAIAKYANRDRVNIEVLILMIEELSVNLLGQRPLEKGVSVDEKIIKEMLE